MNIQLIIVTLTNKGFIMRNYLEKPSQYAPRTMVDAFDKIEYASSIHCYNEHSKLKRHLVEAILGVLALGTVAGGIYLLFTDFAQTFTS
jgi:hypothetical protein